MSKKPGKLLEPKFIESATFEHMVSDLSMALWNRISHLPHMRKLHPSDYAGIYEAVTQSLRHYCLTHR